MSHSPNIDLDHIVHMNIYAHLYIFCIIECDLGAITITLEVNESKVNVHKVTADAYVLIS